MCHFSAMNVRFGLTAAKYSNFLESWLTPRISSHCTKVKPKYPLYDIYIDSQRWSVDLAAVLTCPLFS